MTNEKLVTNSNGGRKLDGNKPRLHLYSAKWLWEGGEVLTEGGDTYGDNNWRLVERDRYIDAFWRHWLAYLSGEKIDPKSGKSHLSHIHCNAMFLWEKDWEEKEKSSHTWGDREPVVTVDEWTLKAATLNKQE